MTKRLLMIFFSAGMSLLSLRASILDATNPVHKYSIYYSSEENENLHDTYGSFLDFYIETETRKLMYVYFINKEKNIMGHVLEYEETPQGYKYTLERFFGQSNATMLILNMPTADNIKMAMIYYADEKEDKEGTCWQNILMDEDIMTRMTKP